MKRSLCSCLIRPKFTTLLSGKVSHSVYHWPLTFCRSKTVLFQDGVDVENRIDRCTSPSITNGRSWVGAAKPEGTSAEGVLAVPWDRTNFALGECCKYIWQEIAQLANYFLLSLLCVPYNIYLYLTHYSTVLIWINLGHVKFSKKVDRENKSKSLIFQNKFEWKKGRQSGSYKVWACVVVI